MKKIGYKLLLTINYFRKMNSDRFEICQNCKKKDIIFIFKWHFHTSTRTYFVVDFLCQKCIDWYISMYPNSPYEIKLQRT